jgi:hypothetical protein
VRALALVALAGCYGDVRLGVNAPAGHGHGGAATELALAAGVEHDSDRLAAGGGVTVGERLEDKNGYVPYGIEGRVALPVTRFLDKYRNSVLAVLHGGIAYAAGSDKKPAGTGMAPSGFVAQAFVGLGYGGTRYYDDPHLWAFHGALGLSASRFFPEAGDSFWFLGLALELSFTPSAGSTPL